MSRLVLDSEAFSRIARARAGASDDQVMALLSAAFQADSDVVVPAAVLAEQYRGGHHDQVVDACLGRNGGVFVIGTDLALARQIGHILAAAGRGSQDHVDATVVACAKQSSSAVIVTGDPDGHQRPGGCRSQDSRRNHLSGTTDSGMNPRNPSPRALASI